MIGAGRGCGLSDHLSLAYDEPGDLQSRTLEFLADGLAQGRRVCYAANRDAAVLWDDTTGAVVEPIGLEQAYAAMTTEQVEPSA